MITDVHALLKGLALSVFLLSVTSFGGMAAEHPVSDAAAKGDASTVKTLLRNGADVNSAQGDGMTALHWAAVRGDMELAAALIYAGANVDAGTRIGRYTPLHIASREGHAELVEALLLAKADLDAVTTNTGVVALHLAAVSGNSAAVSVLIDHGADVNARAAFRGQTPLVFASAAGRTDVVNILLKEGAVPSVAAYAIDVVKQEKADNAAEKRLTEILAGFKQKEGGGNDWQPSPSQVQAAIRASREIQRRWPDVPDPADDKKEEKEAKEAASEDAANEQTAEVEKAEGAADEEEEPKPPTYGQLVGNWGGLTPLLHAVRQGHTETALALLAGGAGVNQVSDGDKTAPLLMAAVNGQFDLMLLLIEKGADPNMASDAGATPLFAVLERQWASRSSYSHPVDHEQQQASHIDVIKALLEAGADPNVRLNKDLWYTEYTFSVLRQAGLHVSGATPFWRAALALDVGAMRLLREYGAEPNIPTAKLPKRKRKAAKKEEKDGESEAVEVASIEDGDYSGSDEEQNENEDEDDVDHSGLPPVPVGGPFIYPLHAAAGAGYGQYYAGNAHRHEPNNWLNTVKFLIEECGIDVNIRDANGYSALHHAASRGDDDVVRYLVSKGADVTFVSRKGQTTADMANGPIQRVPPFPTTIALLVGFGSKNNDKCVSC